MELAAVKPTDIAPRLTDEAAAELAALHGEYRRAAQLKHIADHDYASAAARYEAAASRALLACGVSQEDGYRVTIERGVPALVGPEAGG